MTSSSKKKKNKRADFQKVKLKVGRRLPKGQNVTNTTFKTRKIKIREQAREIAPPSLNATKKANFQDLLRSLNHQNANTRQNAINGLKNLLNHEKGLIASNLSSILSNICKRIEDKSSDVRTTAQHILKITLSSTSAKQISPMFPTLNAYLNCGMTHIDQEIQKDSLKFLDIILDHFPQQLTDANPQILTNFLEQISQQTATGSKTNAKSKGNNTPGRMLLINPDRRWTEHAWRLQVLQRVQKFLTSLLSNAMKTKKDNYTKVLNVQWTVSTKYLHVPHPDSLLQKDFPFGGFTFMSNNTLQSTPQSVVESVKQLENFMTSLLPLLIETWIEASPMQKVKNIPANNLPIESLETLVCLVEIIKIMIDWIENFDDAEKIILQEWFNNTFEKKFVNHFMKNFPYLYQENIAKKNENKNSLLIHCCNLNLSICNIFCRLVTTNIEERKHFGERVITYLIALVNNREYKMSIINSKAVIGIVKIIGQDENLRDLHEHLLSNIVDCYDQKGTPPQKKIFFISLFCSILLDPSQKNVSSSSLTKWLLSLPAELMNTHINADVLTLVSKLCREKNEAVLYGVQTLCINLIGRLQQFQVKGDNTCDVERTLIEILLHVKYFDDSAYELLAQYVRNEEISIESRCYCIEVIGLRYRQKSEDFNKDFTRAETGNYISFLLRLILGTGVSISAVEDDSLPDKNLPLNVKIVDANLEEWNVHEKIVHHACLHFKQFENTEQLEDILSTYFMEMLNSPHTYTLTAAWSVLKLIKELKLLDSVTKFNATNVLEFVLAVAFAEIVYELEGNTVKLFGESLLLAHKSVEILLAISKELQSETQTNNFCTLTAQILKQWTPPKKYHESFENVVEILKLKLGSSCNDSLGWNALSYGVNLLMSKV